MKKKYSKEEKLLQSLKAIKLNKAFWGKFIPEFVYNCNAIEGSKLSRKDVKRILRKKPARITKKHKK